MATVVKVYVVMTNDFPARVYAERWDAEKYCDAENRKEEEREKREKPLNHPRIFYRVYGFGLVQSGEDKP